MDTTEERTDDCGRDRDLDARCCAACELKLCRVGGSALITGSEVSSCTGYCEEDDCTDEAAVPDRVGFDEGAGRKWVAA